MERHFDNREFEQYIKRNADQYRMMPSEKVWRSISNNLHTRRRWYGLGLSLLLLGSAVAVTWVMLSYPGSSKHEIAKNINSPVIGNPQVAKQIENAVTAGSLPVFNSNNLKKQNADVETTPIDDLTVSNNLTEISSAFIIEAANTSSPSSRRQLNRLDDNAVEESINSSAEVKSSVSVLTDKLSSQNYQTVFDPSMKLSEKETATNYPLTIESVINSYQGKKTSNFKRKISWQVYFTPTVSYRKLRDNKKFQSSPFFINNRGYGYPFATSGNVNNEVTHKPDLGLELGFSAGYPISKTFTLTAGLQFNINRYDIMAYLYNREPATINLNGDSNNPLTTWTSYRNYNGYKSDWLKNFYFSASAPVGARAKLLGNNKTYFGVAGTVQPTLILRDRAYLISSDYKNYAEVPDLIRRFNVNTSFETFISYKKRNTRWQIGPQVRYQVLSSFKSKYPVKENLFDFGVRVGISLNQ